MKNWNFFINRDEVHRVLCYRAGLISISFLIILLAWNVLVAKDSLQINSSEKGVALLYQGVERLSSGNPVFDNQIFKSKADKEEGKFVFRHGEDEIVLSSKVAERGNIVSLNLVASDSNELPPQKYLGLSFQEIPGFSRGVSIWRYAPWKAWTRPFRIEDPAELKEKDIQFFYWQYEDSTYGAAVPLSGSGYRTTLGNSDGKFTSKAKRYGGIFGQNSISQMALGFGKEPFRLFEQLYEFALKEMGRSQNLVEGKDFPEQFEYIGWCTWNASDMGKKLDKDFVFNSVKNFKQKELPLGWVLIDDGWFQHTGSQLQSLRPDTGKFPNGFEPMIKELKSDLGIRDVGIWHTLNGYWNGIDPESELGEEYSENLFSWKQKERPDKEDAPQVEYHFIENDAKVLEDFFNQWHSQMVKDGADFVKVDNQLVVERMAKNNFAIWDYASNLHTALNQSVNEYFDGGLINCMDMTADAYFNFGNTSVARAVEDYFPYESDETYNLEKGNAAAHVTQAVYNSIYFGQMVYPDFDMFETYNPNADLHAVARTLNNGPIYITDKPGRHKADVLEPIIYSDGRIIRSEAPLLPAEDALFQLQRPEVFKAWSMASSTGILGVMNLADRDTVSGHIKPSDIPDFNSNREYAVYHRKSGNLRFMTHNESWPVKLSRMGHEIFYVIPHEDEIIPIGLIDKYNAPATILDKKQIESGLQVELYEGGTFAAITETKPKVVKVEGEVQDFTWEDNVLKVQIPLDVYQRRYSMEIINN